MPSRLLDTLTTTEELAGLFSDRSVIEALLRFECALARAQARLGIIPNSAADVIAKAAIPDAFDPNAIAAAVTPRRRGS